MNREIENKIYEAERAIEALTQYNPKLAHAYKATLEDMIAEFEASCVNMRSEIIQRLGAIREANLGTVQEPEHKNVK